MIDFLSEWAFSFVHRLEFYFYGSFPVEAWNGFYNACAVSC